MFTPDAYRSPRKRNVRTLRADIVLHEHAYVMASIRQLREGDRRSGLDRRGERILCAL